MDAANGFAQVAKVGITIVARAKHRGLFDAVKKIGTVAKLGEHIGVHLTILYRWLALRGAPPMSPTFHWPQERIDELEKKLIDLTGQTLEQLFPAELRSKEFQEAVKVREFHRDIDLTRLGQYRPDVLALPSPEQVLQTEDLSKAIEKAIAKLSYREREIIKMRFGLGGDRTTYTLEEVGHVFKVTKERIRNIETRAIHKLREMKDVAEFFCAAAPDEWVEPPRNLRRFDERQDVSLKERYAEEPA